MSTKIFLLMFILALFMVVCESLIVINHSSDIIKEDALAYNQRVTEELSKSVYQYFNNIENKLYGIYSYEEEMFELKKYADVEPYGAAMVSLAEDFFTQHLSDIYEIMSVYILGYDNRCISSYSTRQSSDTINLSIDKSIAWYSGSLREYWLYTNNNVYVYTYTLDNGKPVIRMGIKIYDVVSGQYFGSIMIEMDGEKLDKLIEEYRTYDDQTYYLITNNNEVLYPYYISDNTAQQNYDQFNGYKMHGAIPKYAIQLINLFSIESVSKNFSSSLQIVFISVIVLLIIAIILAFVLSSAITRSLYMLTKKMKQVEKGDTSTRITIKNNDEIGDLANGFNAMITEIDDLINQEYRLNIAMHETRLKALQAQVNPHFLYNTLQAMGSISRRYKADMLYNMCTALSDIFRYSISMKENYASVRDELTHVYNYVYIQNVRFNNKIKLKVHCETDLYDCIIPRLTLQPIVENAIEHGLLQVKKKKLLRISIRKVNDRLIIYVADNGCGMSPKQLVEKQNRLSNGNTSSLSQSESIGLTNVKERLILVFGSNANMKLYSKQGEGTIVLLDIKLVKKGEEDAQSVNCR